MAHTLTFTSSVTITVNGVSVTSPYTLQNGDTIVVTWGLVTSRPIVNGVMYRYGDTLNIQDANIEVELYSEGGSSN